MRFLSSLALSAALLASCVPPLVLVAPTRAHVALRAVVMAEADPEVRSSCTQSIVIALRRRGFILDRAGYEIEIAVAFLQNPQFDVPSEGNSGDGERFSRSGRTEAPQRRVAYTAELKANLPNGKKAMGSGSGEAVETANGALSRGVTARADACSVGAERLADSMVEAVGKP
jgi:hypothetical protein